LNETFSQTPDADRLLNANYCGARKIGGRLITAELVIASLTSFFMQLRGVKEKKSPGKCYNKLVQSR